MSNKNYKSAADKRNKQVKPDPNQSVFNNNKDLFSMVDKEGFKIPTINDKEQSKN